MRITLKLLIAQILWRCSFIIHFLSLSLSVSPYCHHSLFDCLFGRFFCSVFFFFLFFWVHFILLFYVRFMFLLSQMADWVNKMNWESTLHKLQMKIEHTNIRCRLIPPFVCSPLLFAFAIRIKRENGLHQSMIKWTKWKNQKKTNETEWIGWKRSTQTSCV